MNVQVTPNYRIKTDSQQFIVEERRIVDPTKAPEHLRRKAATSTEIREEYRPVAYYGLTPASLESALNYVLIRESIDTATDANAAMIGELITTIRDTAAGIREGVRIALRAEASV